MVLGIVVVLIAAGSAVAIQCLPEGGQVNDDPAAGINKAISVSGVTNNGIATCA